MKERILKGLTPEQVVELLASRKWNFFQRRKTDEGVFIRVEAPVGTMEAYVIELGPYAEMRADEITALLRRKGFIEEEIRITPD